MGMTRHGQGALWLAAQLPHDQTGCSAMLNRICESTPQALALGADAVLLGRPVLWGLTLGGQAGVEQVLRALQSELELAMVSPSVA